MDDSPRGPRAITARDWQRPKFPLMPVLIVGIIAFIAGFAIPTPSSVFHIVYAGHVGVRATWGQVEPEPLVPGFYILNPISQRVFDVDVRVLPHNFKQIDAASKELQSVKLTGTMNYHIEPGRVPDLYQRVGIDFVEKIIDPAFADFVKEVVPQYAVIDILSKRDEIRVRAREALGRNIERYGVTIDDIYISEITFSPDYQAAIEKKQTAQQQVEAERQILAQKQIQATQAVVEAQARADSRVAVAEGDAKANRSLTESLSPQLIDYLRWTRWDGRLPMVTGERGALIQVPLPPDTASPAPSGQAATPAAATPPQVVGPITTPAARPPVASTPPAAPAKP